MTDEPKPVTGVGPGRWGLLAAALAGVGQALLWWRGLPAPTALPRFAWGVLLLSAAVVLFAAASRHLSGRFGADPEPDDSPAARPFAFGLAPALAVSFLNALVFLAAGETAWTRWLWLLSIALLFWPAAGERPSWTRPPVAVVVAVTFVVAVAFLARAMDLEHLPLAFHGDMAEMGLGGRELLRGRVDAFVSVGWASIPWTGFLPAALGLAVSDDIRGLRLASALLGTAAVAGVYFLGALLFGRRVGIVAAGAAAVGFAEIHFSRLPAYGDPVPFVVFALYFLLRALRTGERPRFVLAGALMGASCLLYYSGRVAPVLAATVLAHAAAVRPSLLRRRWRGLAAAVLGALVTVGPMIFFFAERPGELNARLRDVSVFKPQVARHLRDAYGVHSLPAVIARQAARSALVFHHTADTSLQFGFPRPMLSPFLAPFAALGLGACLARLRRSGPALLVAWWAAVLLGGAVFTADAPFWPRLVVVLPAAALLVAVGFELTLDALGAAASRPVSGGARLMAAASLLAAAGAVNWSWYTARARVHVDSAEWLGRLLAHSPAERFCMVPGPLSFREEEIRFLAPGSDVREVAAADLASCVAERRVIVVYEREQPELLAAARKLAPGARYERHDYPNGLPGPVFLHPPGS